jgi:hypothetical protein
MFIKKRIILPLLVSEGGGIDKTNDHSDMIYVSKHDYTKITNFDNKSNSMIFRISNEFHNSRIVRVAGYHDDDKCIVYCPTWLCDVLCGMGGLNSFDTRVTLTQLKNIPRAKYVKIKLDEKDSDLYTPETNHLFEDAISKYGCIQKMMTIPLHLPELYITIYSSVEEIIVEDDEEDDKDGYARFDGEIAFDIVRTLREEVSKSEDSLVSKSEDSLVSKSEDYQVPEEPKSLAQEPQVLDINELRKRRLMKFM